jgi:hypothetical protein
LSKQVLTAERKELRQRAAALLLAAVLAWPLPSLAALRVAVISDMNGSYGSTSYERSVDEAVQRIAELRPDLVISTGDMVAGQRLHPPLAAPAVAAMWTAFNAKVSGPLAKARIPLAVTPGNHDASAYASFALEREAYREQWLAHRPAVDFVDSADYPFHYAFAMDGVLFISLDVTKVGALEPTQKRWLDDLLSKQAGRYRQRVVFSHLPVYPFAQGRETEVSADHELEALLERHGVEMYLSGHHHAFYPGYHGGIRHVSQACLGAGPRALIGVAARSPRAITLLEFTDAGQAKISALSGPGFTSELDFGSLPERIVSRYGTLVRDDLRHGEREAAKVALVNRAQQNH